MLRSAPAEGGDEVCEDITPVREDERGRVKTRAGVRGAIEYAAAVALLKSFGWIPRVLAYPAAEIVAALGFGFAGRQRRAGFRNLKMAMPHLNEHERRAILRGSFS